MEVYASIVGALVAVMLGAWINNVFTWRIKNKIDALDELYNNLRKLDHLFLKLVRITVNFRLNSNMLDKSYTNEQNIFYKEQQEIDLEIHLLIQGFYLLDSILDKKFNRNLLEYTQIIDNRTSNDINLLKHHKINPQGPESEEVRQYVKATEFFNEILAYRKQITSFGYMLKQLNPFKIRCFKQL